RRAPMSTATPTTAPAVPSQQPAPAAPPPASPRHFFVRLLWLGGLLCLASVAIFFAYSWWSYPQSPSLPSDAFVETHLANILPPVAIDRRGRVCRGQHRQHRAADGVGAHRQLSRRGKRPGPAGGAAGGGRPGALPRSGQHRTEQGGDRARGTTPAGGGPCPAP